VLGDRRWSVGHVPGFRKEGAGTVTAVSQVLWQMEPGDRPRTATVHSSPELDLPKKIEITASVSDYEPAPRRLYMQLSVPGPGPVLAWVGVPGGGQRDGHFIHPITGRLWPGTRCVTQSSTRSNTT